MNTLTRFVFVAVLLPLCANAQQSETLNLSGFSHIEVEGDITLDIVQAESYEIVVSTDGGELADIRAELVGRNSEVLRIELDDSNDSRESYSATISLPELREFQLTGSGNANIGDFEFEDLGLGIVGSGDIQAKQLAGDDLFVEVSGSGEVIIASVDATSVELKIAGSGEVDISQINAEDVDAKIAGSGDISVDGDVTNLSIVVAGSGEFEGYDLTVENLEGVIAGSGEVDIGEVTNDYLTTNGDLTDLIGLQLDMTSMFEDIEEIEIDFEEGQGWQRSDRSSSRDSSFLEDLIPFAAFAVPIIIVALAVNYKYKKRRLEHETLRKVVESGQPLPENLMEVLSPEEPPKSSIHSGANLIALGLGIAVFFLIVGSAKAAALGCIPGFVGVAKFLVWFLENK